VLVAFVILGILIALVIRFTPHRTADLSLLKTSTYAAHTVFTPGSIVVNSNTAEDDLYLVADLRIEDRLNLPIFLKDFTATIVTAEGETLHASAVEKPDLESLYTTFPAVRKLASAPLLRETFLSPAGSTEGTLIFRFTGTQETWDKRQSARIIVDFYHQGPLAITIPTKPGEKSRLISNPASFSDQGDPAD